MTTKTVFVPVLIETAAQAEQLPVGTVAYLPGTGGWVDTAAKVGPSRWCGGDDDPGTRDLSMVGWTALVPVEAEEEWAESNEFGGIDPTFTEQQARDQSADHGNPPRRRYVTRWEDA